MRREDNGGGTRIPSPKSIYSNKEKDVVEVTQQLRHNKRKFENNERINFFGKVRKIKMISNTLRLERINGKN